MNTPSCIADSSFLKLSRDADSKASLQAVPFAHAAGRSGAPPRGAKGFSSALEAHRNAPLRALEAGARIANFRGAPGTLGCFARTLDDHRLVFLTSHHVVFGSGAGEQEPVWFVDSREPHSPQRIGHSRHGRCGIVRYEGMDVHVDCATVEIDERTMPQGWCVQEDPMGQGRSLAAGDHVTKNGAATGNTHGIVEDTCFSQSARVEGRRHEVVGQILVRPVVRSDTFTADGDSGAALLNREGLVVGLLWGVDARGYGLACPIAPVLRVLHVCLARFEPTGAS